MDSFKLNTIEEAIEDFREGKFLIVVDDEDRENEGDFIIAAEKITPEKVNFMVTNGRGVLCAPLPISRCKELELELKRTQGASLQQVAEDLLAAARRKGQRDDMTVMVVEVA